VAAGGGGGARQPSGWCDAAAGAPSSHRAVVLQTVADNVELGLFRMLEAATPVDLEASGGRGLAVR
jgi:hypothetical protein